MITMQERQKQKKLKNLSKVFYSTLILAIITGIPYILLISIIVIKRYYNILLENNSNDYN